MEVLGVSYGAFLGFVLGAIDSESSHPMINGSVTLLSPVLNLSTTHRKKDELMDRHLKETGGLSERRLLLFATVNNLLGAIPMSPIGMTEKNSQVLKSVIAEGYFEMLDELIVHLARERERYFELGSITRDNLEALAEVAAENFVARKKGVAQGSTIS